MRGTITDLLIIMLVITILSIVFGIMYFIGKKTEEALGKVGVNVTYIQKVNEGYRIFMNGIPFMTLTLGIVAIILAWNIPAHPVFAPLSFIILSLYIVLSTMFSNIFYNLAGNTILTPIFNEFPILVYIFRYLPYVIGILGFIIIIVQYSKVAGVRGW